MKLLVIEGVDGSGKSTQIKILTKHLIRNGYNCEFLHFPRTDAPFFGELISRFLSGEFGSLNEVDPYLVALLYAGDRKDAADKIREWLGNNKIVLLDRYTYSNIAYQCAKIDDDLLQEKLLKWILKLEFDHFAIPKPDLNIFLDVPVSFTETKLMGRRSGIDRKYLDGTKDIHEENLNFQKKVRDIYLKLAGSDDRLVVADCCDTNGLIKTPEMISSLILNLIHRKGLI